MENQIKNEVSVMDQDEKMIAELSNERVVSYCSLKPESKEDQILLFNAMNNPDERLSDHINETIEIKHIFCEIVNCTNEETGDITQAPRIVLIATNGKSYQCVSQGIFSACKKIFQVMGEPNSWTSPIKVKVQQVTRGVNKMLSLKMVA